MIIKILTIGHKPNGTESETINYYQKQLPKNLEVNFINLRGEQNSNLSKKEALLKESKIIFSKISKSDYVVSWDSRGKQYDSLQFSEFVKESQLTKKEIIFIIGGSFGLSDQVLARSDLILSASLLTFPHRLFRLILMEQIYRAYTIITKKTYHK